MYNILIVDDEKGITEGIKFIIQRDMPECRVVGITYNGVEGFDLAMELKPDIILTDIRMPQADGLEMVQKLKGAGCKAEFIILSGYSEFEYAKKAIALGVRFYINKPVEEEEIYDVIHKVCLEIDAERKRLQEIIDLENTVQSNLENIKEYVLRDVLDSVGNCSESMKYLLESCGFEISHKQYLCALIELQGDFPESEKDAIKNIINEIKTELRKHKNMTVLRFSSMQIAIILSQDAKIDCFQVVTRISAIRNTILSKWGVHATTGVGLVYEDIDGISKSFREAWQALSYRVIKGVGSVILYSDIQKNSGSNMVVTEEEISTLETCIDNMDVQGFDSIIAKMFKKLAVDGHFSPEYLQILCFNILLSGIKKMSVTQLQLNEFVGKNILSLESISRFKTLEQLRNFLVNTIHAIIELRRVPTKKDVITEIKEYLADHYAENISLAELSERFFINPYYLSQLFKEKTGDTYLSYLTRLRINKAKEFLKESNLKVYEICEIIGYSDTNYFSKLFERFEGCKPSEFKKIWGQQKP